MHIKLYTTLACLGWCKMLTTQSIDATLAASAPRAGARATLGA